MSEISDDDLVLETDKYCRIGLEPGESRVDRVLTFEDTLTSATMKVGLSASEVETLVAALTAPRPLRLGDDLFSSYRCEVIAITDEYVVTKDSDDEGLCAYTPEEALSLRDSRRR